MPEETNQETIETTEEQVNETEQTNEAQQAQEEQEQGAEEQPEAKEPDFEMDFSDIPSTEPAKEEPDYDKVIEEIVQKTLEKQKVKEVSDKEDSDDDDVTYLTKKELAEYTKKIEQEIFGKMQKQTEAQRMVHENIMGSQQIKTSYGQKMNKKLEENNIKLEENPQLKMAADMLFQNMEMSLAAQKGRLVTDPESGRPVPVLTKEETASLTKQHWDIFTKTYLPGYQPTKVQAKTNPLGAGAAATGKEPETAAPNDDYQQFLQKKAAGKETMQDALNLLLKTSQKK